MPDYGARYTDNAINRVERELHEVYKQAKDDLEEKLNEFYKKHKARDREKRKQLADGEITRQEYQDWLNGQIFQREQWKRQIKQINHVLYDTNSQAVKIVNDRRLDVFAENYNYFAYLGEENPGISFELYDARSVSRLIRDHPKILPEWKIDEEKDYTWNAKKVNNIVTQGIIQGEGVEDITKRLSRDLSSQNENKMRMFARTAMTGAQNAGRQQCMEDTANMGIETRKEWVATLDKRTRDSHRHLDGQEVAYDEDFMSDHGAIRYPGDPEADPAEVFNCRCTMVTIFPKYEDRSKRNWREDEVIDGQTYAEWKQGKTIRGETQNGFDRATVTKDIVSMLEKNAFNGNVPESYKKAIVSSLENADSNMLRIVQRTMDKVSVHWMEENPAHNVSHYTEGSGQIQLITKDASGELRTDEDMVRTFWHEYGHYVDDAKISGSGYGRNSEYGDYYFYGIQTEIMQDDKWMYASMEDANKLLKFAGLDDRYECRFESGMYGASIFKKTGEWVDARNPNFETMNELEDGLTKWVDSFSKSISLDDYRKQYGYPERPNREEYIESYFTPKRNLYRERELYKGASEAYHKAINEYYEKVQAFESTHDMQKIYDAWREVADEANRRKEAVAPATDTFDGGVGGAFYAFILHGGHEPKYYAINRMGAKEGIANVFSALMTKDSNVLEAMNELCPNTFNLIKGVILK